MWSEPRISIPYLSISIICVNGNVLSPEFSSASRITILYSFLSILSSQYILLRISLKGFLPNYAFPRLSTTVSFYDSDYELTRSKTIALSEFGPGNTIYFKGNRNMVTHACPRTIENKPAFETLLICNNCGAAYRRQDIKLSACRVCRYA